MTESNDDGYITGRYVVPEEESQVKKHYYTILTWALGHELGHLIKGHEGRFYFEQHTFDKAIPTSRYCHKIELEADSFLVPLTANADGYDNLYLFLYDLVNREIHRQVCPDQSMVLYCDKVYPGTGLAIISEPIAYEIDKSHPDYIIRLLRIIDLIQDRQDFGLLAYQARQLISNGIIKPPQSQLYNESCSTNLNPYGGISTWLGEKWAQLLQQ
jgi:hypothetical protein